MTPTFARAPGEATGMFALECAIDELAHELEIDPLEFRLRNHADVDPLSGNPWSSKGLRECYQRGAERIGWHSRNPAPPAAPDGHTRHPAPRAARDGHGLRGLGVARAVSPVRPSRGLQPHRALARLYADGTAV